MHMYHENRCGFCRARGRKDLMAKNERDRRGVEGQSRALSHLYINECRRASHQKDKNLLV